jgi:hypothetical protein
MANDLINNINKIHFSELGIIRIRKNIEFKTNDVINWCKKVILNADNMLKRGKNWYVYKGEYTITINARSYTIITAHKKQ